MAFFPFVPAFAETMGAIKSTSFITGGTVNGPTILANDFYDRPTNIGDLDNDGIIDIAVGTFGDDTVANRTGSVHISYLNPDGTVKSTVKITTNTANGPTLLANDMYGRSVANIGDLDNDGIQDLLVGAHGDDTGGTSRGAAYIHFMNRNGSIKSTVKLSGVTANGATLADSDLYGLSVGGIGDLDNDGIPDIMIGADGDDTGGTNRGAVYIHYMNRNGSIKSTVKLSTNTLNGAPLIDGDNYGSSISSIGDLDNDGIPDIAIAAWGTDTSKGAAYIHFMNRDGSIKSTKKIGYITSNGPALSDSDFYGTAMANLGDLDNDGIQDIGIGAAFDDTGGSNYGALYIHYMNRDGSVKSTVKLTGSTANGAQFVPSNAGEQYGYGVAGLGDLNGDGALDIAVGAELDTYTGGPGSNSQYGRVFIHFMQPVLGHRFSRSSLAVTEGGGSDSVNVSLKSKPTATVTVSATSALGRVTISPSVLTFTTSNWNTPQTVSITPIDDQRIDGVQTDTLVFANTTADTDYGSLSGSLPIVVTDNDFRGARIITPIIPSTKNTKGEPLGFSINNGATSTSNRTVTLSFNADPETTKGYVASTDPTFKDSVGVKSYAGTDTFTLPAAPGTYTIYLKYYSTTGQFSDVIARTIRLGSSSSSAGGKSSILKKGDRSEAVKTLQVFLNTHGFIITSSGAGSPGKETAYFGDQTEKALMRFQKANKISPDGRVGPQTAQVIADKQ